MIKLTNRAGFPKCIRHFNELKGICIGDCIRQSGPMHEGIGGAVGGVAHAHPYVSYVSYVSGWICLKFKYQLKERLTLLHEVAHLIANTDVKTPAHGKRWRETVMAIGGTYKPYWCYTGRACYWGYGPRGAVIKEIPNTIRPRRIK
jgi:hypothetical protein